MYYSPIDVATVECIKLLEIVVPCYLCTRCDAMQRKFLSMFYTVTTDRRSSQLNAALRSLNLQLSQEKYKFSAGGMVDINTEMLGKVSKFEQCHLYKLQTIYFRSSFLE